MAPQDRAPSSRATTLLTVSVTPGANPPSTGLTVTRRPVGHRRLGAQSFFDDATNGDVTAGDNVFTFSATVAAGTTPAPRPSLPRSRTPKVGRRGDHQLTVIAAPDPTEI